MAAFGCGPGPSVVCVILAGMPACSCCRSPNAHFGRTRAPDGLPVQVRVCAICEKHLGSDPRTAQKRDDDHYEQWRYDMDVALENERIALQKREAEIADLKAQILQLQEELAARPVQVVHKNLDQETVDVALKERERPSSAVCITTPGEVFAVAVFL